MKRVFWFAISVSIVCTLSFCVVLPRLEEWTGEKTSVFSSFHGSSAYAKWLPDPKMTPGAVFQGVTAQHVSAPGYASSVRDVPESVKKKVYAEYGITSHAPHEYEIDHLVSLELAGSNDISNLWPQPYKAEWNALQKDKLENRLHYMVVHGKISLSEAQHAIATDWIAAYKKYCTN